jgi:hypothetical protein
MEELTKSLKPGEVSYLQVMHDSDCPMLAGGSHCVCEQVEVRLHHDQDHFLKTELMNRAARRRAARSAAKVMRKAKGSAK